MRDFWAFRTMITPVIIEVIFWIGAIIAMVAGLIMFIYGISNYAAGAGDNIWKGVLLFVLGPVLVRIYCEIMIVFFRINETLTEIKHLVERQAAGEPGPKEAA